MASITMYKYTGVKNGDEPVLLDDKELVDGFFQSRYAEGVNYVWSRSKLTSYIVSKWLAFPDKATEDHLVSLIRERIDPNMALKATVLKPEQVAELNARTVNIDLTEYKECLGSFNSGEWVKIELDGEEDTPRAIRRRFTLAAKEMGVELKYKKNPNEPNAVIFQVNKNGEKAPKAKS